MAAAPDVDRLWKILLERRDGFNEVPDEPSQTAAVPPARDERVYWDPDVGQRPRPSGPWPG